MVAWVAVVKVGVYLYAAYKYFTQPKPKGPDLAEPWETLSFPEAESGAPIPVVFGTRWVENPNVVWYGDLRTSTVRVRSS